MAWISSVLSAGAQRVGPLVRKIFGLPAKAAKLAWFAFEGVAGTLWWWGLLTVRFFGSYYVWLFLMLFFVWIWWQGGHLLLTMSNLIAGYSTRLIEDGGAGQNYEGIRNLLLGLAALLSVPFFFLRTWINERQTRTQEQGHMTDRIAKAVEALGAEKQIKNSVADADHGQQTVEISVPNLEVRIGAIYALERISQDSARDHWQVMEILTAYLRENAKEWPNNPPPALEERQELLDWKKHQGPARIDFQAIITVLARRSMARRLEEERKNQSLDLRGVHLCSVHFGVPNGKADFARADLSGSLFVFADASEANLMGADLRSANLSGANLSGANFILTDARGANLSGANLSGVNLCEVVLSGAELRGADLRGANLRGANLRRANLGRANLSEANLSEANLSRANFRRANIGLADLRGAYLREADFRGADLRDANLTGADLIEANLSGAKLRGADLGGADLRDNSFVAEVLALGQARRLDEARLPEGWSVTRNAQDDAWDITTPDGTYVDPRERVEKD